MLALERKRISFTLSPGAIRCRLVETAVQILPVLGGLTLTALERTILVDLAKIRGTERFVEQVLVALVLGIMVNIHDITIPISTNLRVSLVGVVEAARDVSPHTLIFVRV